MSGGHVFSRPRCHVVVILAAALLVYSNTFNAPFVFDDLLFIVDNSEIKNLANLWPPSGTRWLGFLTFAMNYRLGGLNPAGYHITNLFIHMFNSLLVYWIIVLTFRTPYISQVHGSSLMARSKSNKQQSGDIQREINYGPAMFVAFFSALLFACHPVQTGAVTYVWQRVTSLATMFYLLSLVLYIKARLLTQSTEQRAMSNEQRVKRCVLYVGSLLSAVFAMKTKEISFTLPFVIALYEFTFLTGHPRRTLLKRLLPLLPFALTLAIIPLSVLGPEVGMFKSGMTAGEHLRQLEVFDLKTYSKYAYLLTQFRVIVTYIRLLMFPVNQNFDYDYPHYTTFFNPEVFLSFLLHCSILSLAGYLCMKSRSQEGVSSHWLRLGGFGILWFYMTLSVESSVIPIRDVIFEHRLYLPSLGFFLALTSGIVLAATKGEKAIRPLRYSMLFLIVAFSVAAYARNALWKDSLKLCEDVVRKSPNKSDPHNCLGLVYAERGYLDKAIKEYVTALAINSDNPEAHNNLGVAYEKQGYLEEAIDEYLAALRSAPYYPDARNNLGYAYHKQGHIDKAVHEYLFALKINPNLADTHNNLGNAYADQGYIDNAIAEHLAALKIRPDFAEAHYNLGNAYGKKGLIDGAVYEYLLALKIKPDFVEAHYNLGHAYSALGRINDALSEFQDVIRLNPNDTNARKNIEILLKDPRK